MPSDEDEIDDEDQVVDPAELDALLHAHLRECVDARCAGRRTAPIMRFCPTPRHTPDQTAQGPRAGAGLEWPRGIGRDASLPAVARRARAGAAPRGARGLDRARRAPPGRLRRRPSSLPPATDYPAGRLELRVDGAADALRAAGCQRLRHWRLAAPPADAEALYFPSADAAHEALAGEAGPGRTPGPGEEAQVTPQAVYFRRGAVVVRIFADPGAPADAAPALLRAADALDRAVQASP